MGKCLKCGRALTTDEIGLHKRLMNKFDTEFMCISCLSDFFGCDEQLLKEKIVYFKKTGCQFFSHEKGD